MDRRIDAWIDIHTYVLIREVADLIEKINIKRLNGA